MELIEYGKVVKLHGTKGEIRVFPFSSSFHNVGIIKEIYIDKESKGNKTLYSVENKRVHKGHLLLKLKDLDDPDYAKDLIGCSVFIEKDSLIVTEEDEYYCFELVGMKVVTTNGEEIGKVEDLMETSAHGILIIRRGRDEYLIPLNDKFVTKIDTTNSEITINPVIGLID